jgi:hypothetical protein
MFALYAANIFAFYEIKFSIYKKKIAFYENYTK